MDPTIQQVVVTGLIELCIVPIVVFLINKLLGRRLDSFDEKREAARAERYDDLKRREDWQNAITSGLRSILRAELIAENRKWKERGYAPMDTKEYCTKVMASYTGLGGNGLGKRLYEEIMALPDHPDGEDE